MRRGIAIAVIASCAALSCASGFAQPAAQADAQFAVPSSADIAKWIKQLDADDPQQRESASRKLLAARKAAIVPLTDVVLKSPYEVVVRGTDILRELALVDDSDTQEAAREALERLSSSKLTVAAQRADLALSKLKDLRQARAIEELERLGAKVGTSHVQLGFQIVENASTLEIGVEWRGTTKDLQRLRWLSGIQQVKFTGPKVTNEWLTPLASMPNLTSLTLKRTSVTSDGLASVRNMERLQLVWLMYSPIDDAVVPHLKTLKRVMQIKLYGTKVTRKAATDLGDALPNAKVDHRQGAFMGVNCQAHPLGCEVVLVQPNTAAANAGLEASDVIIIYGKTRVETFESLTSLISENQPGDKVEMIVARDLRVRRGPFEHREGAPLGLKAKPHPLGVEITEVAPDSVASELEFKPGDVITAYKETRTLDPQTLYNAFKGGQVGEAASLDYVRSPEILQKVVTLGEWE
ncbi:MAG: PDZ domain-containing protein [Pirellulales bacterium]